MMMAVPFIVMMVLAAQTAPAGGDSATSPLNDRPRDVQSMQRNQRVETYSSKTQACNVILSKVPQRDSRSVTDFYDANILPLQVSTYSQTGNPSLDEVNVDCIFQSFGPREIAGFADHVGDPIAQYARAFWLYRRDGCKSSDEQLRLLYRSSDAPASSVAAKNGYKYKYRVREASSVAGAIEVKCNGNMRKAVNDFADSKERGYDPAELRFLYYTMPRRN